MKIREALAIAEQRAMGQTQELATRDPMFIRRGLEVKGFIDRQNRFITDRYLQESRITDRKEMKERGSGCSCSTGNWCNYSPGSGDSENAISRNGR
jgi:hypothetical protein